MKTMTTTTTPAGLARAKREVKLSKREYEVLELASHGETNNHIADQLGVGRETIKTHVKKILTKLSAQNRAHAVAIALRKGYIN